jgi:hypothetical protein
MQLAFYIGICVWYCVNIKRRVGVVKYKLQDSSSAETSCVRCKHVLACTLLIQFYDICMDGTDDMVHLVI